jgi:hypothetical protein
MSKLRRLLLGSIPVVDTLGGLYLHYKNNQVRDVKRPALLTKLNPQESLLAKFNPGARGLKRLFEIVAVALVVAVWLGATIAPIPGIGPIAGLSGLALLKVLGISLGYTLAARAVGAFFGNIIDTMMLRHNFTKVCGETKNSKDALKISRLSFFLKGTVRSLMMGVFGELGANVCYKACRTALRGIFPKKTASIKEPEWAPDPHQDDSYVESSRHFSSNNRIGDSLANDGAVAQVSGVAIPYRPNFLTGKLTWEEKALYEREFGYLSDDDVQPSKMICSRM